MQHPHDDDVHPELRKLCHLYGAALFDYCGMRLPPADAERATRGALMSGHHHADRLRDPHQRRAWLYALAHAHRTRRGGVTAAGTDAWTRPGSTADPSRITALAALEPAHQEVLDLALRHELTPTEIALIYDAGAVEIEHLIDAAAAHLEQLIAAVDAARAGRGCPTLADLLTTPGASRHPTRLGRHVTGCAHCRAAPLTATAAGLLAQLPLAAAPATLAARLASAQPLPASTTWRIDGFPEQSHTLHDALATVRSAPRDTTPDRTAGAASTRPAPGRAQEFRAWEQPRHPSEDFWTPRADEADPEARLSLRPLFPALRVGGLIAATVAAVLTAGALWSALQPKQPPAPLAPAAAPATLTPSDSQPPPTILLPEEPPTNPPTSQPTHAPTSSPPARRPARTPTKPPTRRRSSPAGQPAKAASKASPGKPSRSAQPQDPPRPTRQPAATTSRTLPKPPPPAASLSPSSMALGSSRTGSFTLHCTTGTCAVTSATGSNGITVSGTRVTVAAPASRPGCTATTETGTATITWTGTTTGDGHTTAGTTTGGGTLTLTVTWTVEADKGEWIPTGSVTHGGDRQGYWSHCRTG
ncbi:hypothetical protein BKM31_17650 [[Actinomadura] parvosata subsp. kistnae]|uniref:RNA polymerase sigma-70 region 2 domain-containing protein n=1 Tax=[Actinomadura] parvosata subsp. kistnae TaxID=1909395 RepID=A0A1U9ZYM5_9ACTN|nr:hypothetical protein [Nonomuraea sp. ATCC 55076]AQZ63044.1 hypothetical protein BKM31_17650 [Nonomuraea sp. ATCC 55076]